LRERLPALKLSVRRRKLLSLRAHFRLPTAPDELSIQRRELTSVQACDYQRFSYAEHCSADKFV
jgi:hypothetical protein